MDGNAQVKAELLYEAGATLGEGPVWDHRIGVLYWVDIEGCKLHSHNPETGQNHSWDFDGMLGAVVPADDGSLVLAHEQGLLRLDRTNQQAKYLGWLANAHTKLRFNDGKCDPYGNLWIGTMDKQLAPQAGNLYRVDGRGNATVILKGTTVSNGMAWSEDHRFYYYIDSETYELWRFDYDVEHASISNKKVAFNIPREYGAADGMSIDRDGNLWIAHWGGSCIRCWDPASGRVLRKMAVDAPHVTSCCFGGRDLDTLFITTARSGLTNEQLAKYPLSGGLFSCKPGVKGRALHYFKLNG